MIQKNKTISMAHIDTFVIYCNLCYHFILSTKNEDWIELSPLFPKKPKISQFFVSLILCVNCRRDRGGAKQRIRMVLCPPHLLEMPCNDTMNMNLGHPEAIP